ncbi:glycosyltransferase [Lentibacillus sediminis]|uniref:glycosyltransferase n=1 Tax=Lentibacillus sediminis TaxID=1940529 RepID=UPI000C1BE857|nr:glycosyltransferase [Lentibacillus sediminis]
MKILHIISGLGSGGAQKLIEETVPLINDYPNVEVEVLLLNDRNNVFDKKLKNSGIKVEVIPYRNPRSPLNIFYIKKYLNNGKYDIVHVHLFPTNYWVSLASKLSFKNNHKLIFTEHSTHNIRREKWYFKYIDAFIYSNYDKVISISEKTQENLLTWLKIPNNKTNKFIVIENGINVRRFFEATPYEKSEFNGNLNKDNKLLCMVGRFGKQKDQSTIIKAMKKLPDDSHLILIGEGELKQKNEKLAKELGVRSRVHFLGVRNDVEKILKTVDLIILSSHWEGFGLAAVEGMAAEKPVIASNVAGLREVVKGAGILFEKGNSDDLVEKINMLINNRENKKYISSLCSKRANQYDINNMVEKYLNLYIEVLKV